MLKLKGIILSLFFALFLATPSVALAYSVSLAWDPNSEEELAGYRVFAREDGQSYNYSEPDWEGTATTCTIGDLNSSKIIFFVARAFDTGGNESGNSNEVQYTPLGDFTIISAEDVSGEANVGVIFMGYSGRSITFNWIYTGGAADIYQFKLLLIQNRRVFALGETTQNNTNISIPKTGIYAFQIRAGRYIGTSNETWTDWASSDDPNYGQHEGAPASLRFEGWPAPVGPIVIE